MADPERTGAGVPLPIADGLRAMRLLRSEAVRFGAHPHWIGLVGTSAGGHIAASCAAFGDAGNPNSADPVERVSSRPDFLILHSPVISVEPGLMSAGIRAGLLGPHPEPRMVERYTLYKQVGRNWPPTLLVFARNDTIPTLNSYRLIDAIKREGRPVDTLIYDEGGHAFALQNLTGPRAEWPQKWLEWMQAQIRALPRE
jgi:acetyl esterase/lipase